MHIHNWVQIKDDKQNFLKGWGFPIKLLCAECGEVRGFTKSNILIEQPKTKKVVIRVEK